MYGKVIFESPSALLYIVFHDMIQISWKGSSNGYDQIFPSEWAEIVIFIGDWIALFSTNIIKIKFTPDVSKCYSSTSVWNIRFPSPSYLRMLKVILMCCPQVSQGIRILSSKYQDLGPVIWNKTMAKSWLWKIRPVCPRCPIEELSWV